MNNDTLPYSEGQVRSFVEALNKLPDHRDNRGKRHNLAFIISAAIMAMLIGRSKASGIYRYIRNKIEWLRTVTGISEAKAISRAQLPRLINSLDWDELNDLIEIHFEIRIERLENQEWIAFDGKALKGTVKSGNKQGMVLAVTHESRHVVAQATLSGPKSSEIPVVRKLLKDSGLEKQKVSLDAHHCNPETTAQIHRAGGHYLTQVKDNQPVLLAQCKQLATDNTPVGHDSEVDKANGRITERHVRLYSMSELKTHKRWNDSGLQTLIVVERKSLEIKTGKSSDETSYYISNHPAVGSDSCRQLAQAVRKHWSIESENWIRDVTLKEDKVKIRAANQAQITGLFNSLALRLLRRTGLKNFQEAIENFADCADKFEAALKRLRFL